MDEEYRKNLGQLIDLLTKKGCKSFKNKEISLELTGEIKKRPYIKKDGSSELIEVETPYTDQDALFWSSGGVM